MVCRVPDLFRMMCICMHSMLWFFKGIYGGVGVVLRAERFAYHESCSTSLRINCIAEVYKMVGVAQLPSELPQGPAALVAFESFTRTQFAPHTCV